jgi:hypothetical protein
MRLELLIRESGKRLPFLRERGESRMPSKTLRDVLAGSSHHGGDHTHCRRPRAGDKDMEREKEMPEDIETGKLKEGKVVSRDVAAVVTCPNCGHDFFVKKEEKKGLFG